MIDGRTFTHPDLRLQFVRPGRLPDAERRERGDDRRDRRGQAQFSTGRFNGDFGSYIGQVIYGLTGGKAQVALSPLAADDDQRACPPAFVTGRAQTSSGAVDVSVMAYQFDADTAYHFVMLTRGGQGMQPFASMLDSLRRISPSEAAAIRPRVIDVVTVRRGDTVASLAARMAYRDFQRRALPVAQRAGQRRARWCRGRRSSWSSTERARAAERARRGRAAYIDVAATTLLAILPHMPLAPPPSELSPPIIAMTMSAAISPYSIAVAPRLSERRRRNVRIAFTPPSFRSWSTLPIVTRSGLRNSMTGAVNAACATF